MGYNPVTFWSAKLSSTACMETDEMLSTDYQDYVFAINYVYPFSTTIHSMEFIEIETSFVVFSSEDRRTKN